MKWRFIFLVLGLIAFLDFVIVIRPRLQPAQQSLQKLTAQEKQQLQEQQIRVNQRGQQQLQEEEQEQLPRMVIEPNQYYFSNDYYHGHLFRHGGW